MKQKTTLKVTRPIGQRRGISRRRNGHGFRYINARGHPVDDPQTIERINALAIPPAWEDVWISPAPAAHLQVVGRDARKRKQYLYHPAWRAVKEREKYQRILKFACTLPRIRRHLRRDLQTQGLGFDKVLATIISLLDCSLIRIGNPEYARTNGSYGLTTLQDNHVTVSSKDLFFHFRGKSKKIHSIHIHNRPLAQIVKQCRDIPGRHLFQYLDENGRKHKITSSDVNRYLQTVSKEKFSAKDFRTWTATVLMIRSLSQSPQCSTISQIKRNLKDGLLTVSQRLGNTPTICRKSYIHPLVLKRYTEKGNLPVARSVNGLPAGLLKGETQAYAVLNRLLKKR